MLIGGTFVTLWWLERRRPLREQRERKFRHDDRNLAMAAAANVTVRLAEEPVVGPLSQLVVKRRWGLVPQSRLPAPRQSALAVLLMDYTLYRWHVLTHRVPLLWRFHQPHHVDLDLTASTALRFHFGELVLSVAWRAAQVVLIGVSPGVLRAWQTLTLMEIMFHHSNVELSPATESWLSRILVTPKLHGIHHSAVEDETNSNWSSGLTVWDWLHGTLRTGVPQKSITIGLPAYQDPRDVTLPRVVRMPFEQPTDPWRGT